MLAADKKLVPKKRNMKAEAKRWLLILLCFVGFFSGSFLCAAGYASNLGPLWVNYTVSFIGILLFPTSIYFFIKAVYYNFK